MLNGLHRLAMTTTILVTSWCMVLAAPLPTINDALSNGDRNGFSAVSLFLKMEDADGDGIADEDDNCSGSDVADTVTIDGCDTGVENTADNNGCTIADKIAALAAGARTHGQFVSAMSELARNLGLNGRDRGKLVSCAARSDIGKEDDEGDEGDEGEDDGEDDSEDDGQNPNADDDDDGIANADDACPRSNQSTTVVIGDCDTGVENALSDDGCTIADLIDTIRADAANDESFVAQVVELTDQMVADAILSSDDADALVVCATEAGATDELDPEGDADDDGVLNEDDECPESDTEDTIIIDGCDTRVDNLLFADGCTMTDRIMAEAERARNHGLFVSAVTRMVNDWANMGLIAQSQKGRITSCAARSDLPRDDDEGENDDGEDEGEDDSSGDDGSDDDGEDDGSGDDGEDDGSGNDSSDDEGTDSAELDPEGDEDEDGILNADDACPESDMSETIVIDGCDTGVENLIMDDGCTIGDIIVGLAETAESHGDFVSSVSHFTNQLKGDGLISGREKGAITSCAAQSSLPVEEDEADDSADDGSGDDGSDDSGSDDGSGDDNASDDGSSENNAADTDGDGVPDVDDQCAASDMTDVVIIDGCETSVPNVVLDNGCSLADMIGALVEVSGNHGEFVSAVSHLTNALQADAWITGRDKGMIMACAARAEFVDEIGESSVADAPDADGDGIADEFDACPESLLTPDLFVGACNSDVVNLFFDDGCSMMDILAQLDENTDTPGAFVSAVSATTSAWVKNGLITAEERARIISCTGQSNNFDRRPTR